MALFLAILFTKSLVSFNVYLLLFIVVPKSLFSLMIFFIKLNLSSDTFTHIGIGRSDSFFDFSSITLSVIFSGASKNFSLFVIMFPLTLLCAGKSSVFYFSLLSVIFSIFSEIILFSVSIVLVKSSCMAEESSMVLFS